MEIPKVSCPIHPDEYIRGINTDHYAVQKFYCFKCILQKSGDNNSSIQDQKVQTIQDLATIVADYYAKNTQGITPNVKIPSEFSEILSQKAENMEKLNKHIGEEKDKIITIFDEITQFFNYFMTEKKKEYLNTLDQQLANLHNWYVCFEKNIKKTFPTEQDIPSLFPSKDTIINKLTTINDFNNLKVFVRDIKEDLDEEKNGIAKGNSLEERRKAYVKFLQEEISSIVDIKPSFEQVNLDVKSIQKQLQDQVLKFLESSLVMKNPINDDTINLYEESVFVTKKEFKMIQDWIPNNLKFNPKLLYRGSRDGLNANAFHSRCDGKNHTVTIIKAQFKNSRNYIIGGYLDQQWHSSGGYIQSYDSFLFSLTSNMKCPITSNNSNAAYGHSSYGPTFGAGNDLRIDAQFQGHLKPNSYSGVGNLPEYQKYHNGGNYDSDIKNYHNGGNYDSDDSDIKNYHNGGNYDSDDSDIKNYHNGGHVYKTAFKTYSNRGNSPFKVLEIEVYSVY